MSKINFSKKDLNEILKLYNVQYMSASSIAKKFNVNYSVIIRVLKENNIEIRDNNIYKSKNVNINFFEKIDSEEKAYILGFIYADGCVTNHALQIKISEKDIELLEKIKLSLKSKHKIGVYKNNNGYGIGNNYCALRIKNKKIETDLCLLGVIPNKTKILTFPTTNQVPKDLIRHFIRGFFDGDGSIYESENTPSISFTGTYDMLNGVKNEMSKICDTKASIYPYKNKDVFDYKIGGRNQIIKIYDYLYKDATIYLERKKNKFDEILK